MKKLLLIVALLCPLSALAQGTIPFVEPQYFDSNGNPLAGGKLYSYATGTTTPLATYSDKNLNVQNTNPIILGSDGRPRDVTGLVIVSVFMTAAVYEFVMKSSTGTTIWDVPDIAPPATASSAGTTNCVAKFTGPTSLGCGKLTDNGTQVAYPNWTLSTSSAFKINQVGSTGANATSTPSGTDFRPMVTLDLSNPANTAGGKQGLYVNTKMTTSSGTREVTGIWVDSYSLADNGGETSGIHIIDTGASDALSVYHLASERPAGYALPCATCGFGIELGVDHGDALRISLVDNATDGVVFQGRGISIIDEATTSGFADILVAQKGAGLGAARYAFMVNNDAGTDTRFSVRADTGLTYVKGELDVASNIVIPYTHGVYWNPVAGSQSYIVQTGTNELDIRGGVSNINTNFLSNAAGASLLQVLDAGGIVIPATTNQITAGASVINFVATAGTPVVTFAATDATYIPYMRTADGRMLGYGFISSSTGSVISGNNAWINSGAIFSAHDTTTSSNAIGLSSAATTEVSISSIAVGAGTAQPLVVRVPASTVVAKFATSGTDRSCLYAGGSLVVVSVGTGGALYSGGACP